MASLPNVPALLASPYGAPARPFPHERVHYRVLLTLLRPNLRQLPLRVRARRCGLTPNRYTAIAASKEIQSAVSGVLVADVTCALPDLIGDIVANSRMPGRDGLGDRRLLVMMAGLSITKNVNQSEQRVVHEIGPTLAAALAREVAGRAAMPAGITETLELQAQPDRRSPVPAELPAASGEADPLLDSF